MSLLFIIDGYNLINHPSFNRFKKSSKSPAEAIISLIRDNRLTGSSANAVSIVFDGFPPRETANFYSTHETVIYSRKISADEKIKRTVEETANRKNLVVVTDDNEIKFIVKSLGAKCLGIEEFIGKSEKGERQSKKKEPLKQELNYSQMHDITEELKKLWLK